MEDWLHVTPTGGSGNATIEISADENTDTEPRSTTVTISADGCDDVVITVTQAGAAAKLEADQSSLELDAAGTAKSVNVYSNKDWTVA